MKLPKISLSPEINYIGVFLTMSCNLKCAYCINVPEQAKCSRDAMNNASVPQNTMTPEQWAIGLSRLPKDAGLPLTLQGGEPTIYRGGKGLRKLLDKTDNYFDILTNMVVKPKAFAECIGDNIPKLQRPAPYPSIRVSYHPQEMERIWGSNALEVLSERCTGIKNYGFKVSHIKANSDIGIYMVAHPENIVEENRLNKVKESIMFETKEFMGEHNGTIYGTYLYPFSTDLIGRGIYHTPLTCECRIKDLIIDPLGFIWGCHFYLYDSWMKGGMVKEFVELEKLSFKFTKHKEDIFKETDHAPIAHILDEDLTSTAVLREFRPCHHYGQCIGCDTKITNDRFQSLENNEIPFTSVEIRNIDFPPEVKELIDK